MLRTPRHRIERFTLRINLAKLANRAVLAAIHAETGNLDDRDHDALHEAGELLKLVTYFDDVRLPPPEVFKRMPPVTVFEEIFAAIARIDDQRSDIDHVTDLIDSINAITGGSATSAQMCKVKSFFEDLTDEMLFKTSKPLCGVPPERPSWMRKVSNSTDI